MDARSTQITLNATFIVRALFIAAGALVGVSLAVLLVCQFAYGASPHDVRWAQFFYLDGERNVPTAFSVFLLLCASTLLAAIAFVERRRRGFALYWWVLAAGFSCMAIDEAWSFHEKMNAVVRAALGGGHAGIWYYGWVLPALLFVAMAGIFFLRFLMRLPPPTRNAFVVAGMIYVGGAVGMELVEGAFDEVYGDRNLVSGLIATVQESMEMGGVILFLRALLRYVVHAHAGLIVTLETGSAQPAVGPGYGSEAGEPGAEPIVPPLPARPDPVSAMHGR